MRSTSELSSLDYAVILPGLRRKGRDPSSILDLGNQPCFNWFNPRAHLSGPLVYSIADR